MITTNYQWNCERLVNIHQLDNTPNTDETSSAGNDDNADLATKRKEQEPLKTADLFQQQFVPSYIPANYSSITEGKGKRKRITETKLISQPMNLTEIFKTAHHILIVLVSYAVLTCCASSATPLLHPPKLASLLSSTSISQSAPAPDAHHLDPQQYFDAQQHYAQQLYDNNNELKQAVINTNYMTDTNIRGRRASAIGSNNDQQRQWINNLIQAASESEQLQQLESQEVNFNQAGYGNPSAPLQQQQQQQRLHIQDQQPKQQQQYQQHAGSTAPTINRQLITPPQFYELGLAPTNALQIELNGSESSDGRDLVLAAQTQQRSTGARSLSLNTNRQDPAFHQQQQISQNSRSQDVTSNSAQQDGSTFEQESGNNKVTNIDSSSNPDSKLQIDSTEAKNSVSSDTDDNKAVEPRQRRRIFNRILKKAEWNHLFVELSKVFLRYFLDLALKDIIGKQGGGESTTSRKKLDAQSELADLLKDFVKTAISNI